MLVLPSKEFVFSFTMNDIQSPCGVVLMGIESTDSQMQLDWLNPPDSDERKSLMQTIDKINQRYGRHSIRTADQDAGGGWRMRRERLSPCYTTQFEHLLQVN